MLNTAAYKAIKDAVSIDSRKSLFLYAFFISISNIGRIKLTSFIGDKCIALYRDWGQAQKTAYLHRSLRFSEQNNLLDILRNSPHQGIRPNIHSATKERFALSVSLKYKYSISPPTLSAFPSLPERTNRRLLRSTG